MPAIGRQFVAHDVQRLADAGDIASAGSKAPKIGSFSPSISVICAS
jgi:hypothetical protein